MKKVLLSLLVLIVLAAAAAGGWYLWRERHVASFAHTPYGDGAAKTVEIPAGSGPNRVATLLAQHGVVSDAKDFYALVRKEGVGPRLKAGEYEFKTPVSPREVLEKLAAGQVKTYRFTVPEGLRVDEILPILAASELRLDPGTLKKLSADPAFLQKLRVPTKNLEGFLFPDTYTFTRGATEEAVLTKMVNRTFEEYRRADSQRKAGNELGLLETITLASIIEKETGAPEERPRISCVFHNRLRLGMRLGTDPTVIYAMMLLRGTYSKNITRKDLLTPHPYNTYMVKGLPPGPIANAGSAALQAALNPLDCNDLFFVSRNDGTHVFCPDLRCHERAVQQWQVEFFRNKRRGGG